jgi:phosphatidylglycerophosphatase A
MALSVAFSSGHCQKRDAAAARLDGPQASPYGCGVNAVAVALATVGGVGYAPAASGTVGSLVLLPLLPSLAALRAWSPATAVGLVAAFVLAAIWAAGRAEEILGGHDHSCIVVDEVAGMAVAGLFLPATWTAALIAFFVFRLFDVLKPFPAATIDRRVEGGLGVVGDDLVAGAYAGLLTRLVTGLQ